MDLEETVREWCEFRTEDHLEKSSLCPKTEWVDRFGTLGHLLNKTFKLQAWEAPCWGSEYGKNQSDCCRSYGKQRRSPVCCRSYAKQRRLPENSPEGPERQSGKDTGLSPPKMECEQGCVCVPIGLEECEQRCVCPNRARGMWARVCVSQ